MDFSDGYIHHDYGSAQHAIEEMASQTAAIEGILSNLDMELGRLRESWVGDDMDVYTQVQNRWNQAMSNLKTMLDRHSLALGDISDQYRRTEQNGAMRWQDAGFGA